jgi:phenylpropionate dioxygenase-like ring-hydroxylating dioxygenase large terminal subunit
MWSARLGRRPVAEQLLGERVVFARDGGQVVASNGPDSPPVAERLGLIWVFMGDGEGDAPPVEQATPRELLEHDFVMGGNVETRRGGWRFGAENGYDEGHAKYLHRNSLWRLFRLMPTWTRTKVVPTDDGWITRVQTEVHWEADFPGLGT